MQAGRTWTGDRSIDHDDEKFFCPVCGIPLARADFDKPEDLYYCPYCSTRHRPAIV